MMDLTNDSCHPQLARLCGVSRATINNHSRRKKVAKQPVGRAPLLNGTEMARLKCYIEMRYLSNNILNIPATQKYIAEEFQKDICSDTLLNIIRTRKLGKTCTGIPMEVTRLEADPMEIAEYYETMRDFFAKNAVPDSFLFNVDESGFQPWADKTKELCIVPPEVKDKEMFFPVDRSVKRSSQIAGIAADGSCLPSVIIIPRKTIEEEMLQVGYRPENGYHIVSQEAGFITSLIWDFWTETVFIPEVQRRRKQYGYSGEAVILLDGCSSHSTDYFLDECLYNGVTTFRAPAHSSDQCQVLDLGVFGIQKKATKKVRPSERFSQQSKEIIKIFSSWQHVATPANICAAFGQAGFSKYRIDGDPTYYMSVDIKHAQKVRGIEHIPIENDDCKKHIKVPFF